MFKLMMVVFSFLFLVGCNYTIDSYDIQFHPEAVIKCTEDSKEVLTLHQITSFTQQYSRVVVTLTDGNKVTIPTSYDTCIISN